MPNLPPKYREAWPQFNVLQANSAGVTGREVCEFAQEGGYPVGQLFVDKTVGDSFSIQFWFYRPPYLGRVETQCSFEIASIPCGIDYGRFLMLCPTCQRPKMVVIYKLGWQCADCHGLLYRSQIVDRETRMWERKRELQKMRKAGRPAHLRQARFRESMSELKELQSALRGRPERGASAAQSYRVTHRWVAISELESLHFSAFHLSGGQIVRSPWHEGD